MLYAAQKKPLLHVGASSFRGSAQEKSYVLFPKSLLLLPRLELDMGGSVAQPPYTDWSPHIPLQLPLEWQGWSKICLSYMHVHLDV